MTGAWQNRGDAVVLYSGAVYDAIANRIELEPGFKDKLMCFDDNMLRRSECSITDKISLSITGFKIDVTGNLFDGAKVLTEEEQKISKEKFNTILQAKPALVIFPINKGRFYNGKWYGGHHELFACQIINNQPRYLLLDSISALKKTAIPKVLRDFADKHPIDVNVTIQQTDGSSCGDFIILYAWLLAKNPDASCEEIISLAQNYIDKLGGMKLLRKENILFALSNNDCEEIGKQALENYINEHPALPKERIPSHMKAFLGFPVEENLSSKIKKEEKPEPKESDELIVKVNTGKLISAIEEMRKYGKLLRKKAPEKSRMVVDFSVLLEKEAKKFQSCKSIADVENMKQAFALLLRSKDKEMRKYRAAWWTITKNVLIGLSFVGLFFIAGRLIYTYKNKGRALFFGQKDKTTREEKLAVIERSLSGVKLNR